VALGESPGVIDARHLEDALGDVPDREPSASRRGLELDYDGASVPLDLERQRVWRQTAALPRAAASLDLYDVELGDVYRRPYRGPDLLALEPSQTDEAVVVAHDDRDREPHPPARVCHPLNHVDIKNLVDHVWEKDVHDLGLPQGQSCLQGLAHGGYLAFDHEPA